MRSALPAVVLLLLGCSKPPPPLPILDFVAYGDSRHYVETHRQLAASILTAKPRFILHSGDLVDHPDQEGEWAQFRDIVKDLRAGSEFLCAVGDHDWVEGSDVFLKEFRMARWYVDARIGDYHIFVLDSRGGFGDAEQVAWLEKTASASTAKHKFAVFHHPPFMVDPKRVKEAEALRPKIHPLLVKLKFCAAFCGHQHAFYTAVRDGLRYVVTAGGGAPLRGLDPSLGDKADLSRSFHHFCGFTVAGPKIEGRVYGKDGTEAPDLRFTLCEH